MEENKKQVQIGPIFGGTISFSDRGELSTRVPTPHAGSTVLRHVRTSIQMPTCTPLVYLKWSPGHRTRFEPASCSLPLVRLNRTPNGGEPVVPAHCKRTSATPGVAGHRPAPTCAGPWHAAWLPTVIGGRWRLTTVRGLLMSARPTLDPAFDRDPARVEAPRGLALRGGDDHLADHGCDDGALLVDAESRRGRNTRRPPSGRARRPGRHRRPACRAALESRLRRGWRRPRIRYNNLSSLVDGRSATAEAQRQVRKNQMVFLRIWRNLDDHEEGVRTDLSVINELRVSNTDTPVSTR
jgi:hypothetical protein